MSCPIAPSIQHSIKSIRAPVHMQHLHREEPSHLEAHPVTRAHPHVAGFTAKAPPCPYPSPSSQAAFNLTP